MWAPQLLATLRASTACTGIILPLLYSSNDCSLLQQDSARPPSWYYERKVLVRCAVGSAPVWRGFHRFRHSSNIKVTILEAVLLVSLMGGIHEICC
jgi:hypothetical protein